MAIEPTFGKKSVMFVCLGNICRSPTAHCIMRHLIKERGLKGWTIDSSGTGSNNIGKPADPRARKVIENHGLDSSHEAKQITDRDFYDFNFILGMDQSNIDNLKRLAPPESPALVGFLGDFDPEGEKIIRDPYYDLDTVGYETIYEQCYRCCSSFLDKFENK